MSLEGFNQDKAYSKGVLSREGDGLTSSESQATLGAGVIDTFEVSVKKGEKASDSTQVFTGPGAGTRYGSGSAEDVVGWVTPTGNKIAINHGAGSDSIEIVHHSGASIMIDVDGSIFVMPTSRKGFGLHASKGDGVVSAQGRLVLKGTSDITIETEGSMTFNVGKNMFMNVGGDFLLDVSGTMSESIDKAKTVEVAQDYSLTVGGKSRETTADDKRTQVVGDYRIDVANSLDVRTDQDVVLQAQKSIKQTAVEASFFEVSSGKLTIASADDTFVAAKNAVYLQSEDDITLEAADSLTTKGKNIVVSAVESVHVDSGTSIDARSALVDISSTGNFNTYSACTVLGSTGNFYVKANQVDLSALGSFSTLSGCTNISSTGTINIDGTGAMTVDAATIALNGGSPSPGATLAVPLTKSVEVITSRTTPLIQAPDAPEYPPAETIIDNMTTARVAPDFPFNAKKVSASRMSLYENEGDTPNPEASAAAGMNASGGSQYSKGDSQGTIETSGNFSVDGSNNNAKATSNPYPIPSSLLNAESKLSRSVTVGMFPGLHACPKTQMGLSQSEIIQNASHLCYNIIDPLLEKFGSSMTILDGLRIGNGGSRHYLGKALDIRASSRDHAQTAMIAKWIVENLPYDRCFLEANKYGTIHCHVEAAPAGTGGARVVWTCADPKCHSKTDGLQLSFAQQGLRNMGFS